MLLCELDGGETEWETKVLPQRQNISGICIGYQQPSLDPVFTPVAGDERQHL